MFFGVEVETNIKEKLHNRVKKVYLLQFCSYIVNSAEHDIFTSNKKLRH